MKPDKRVFWILKTPGGEFLEYSTEPMNYDWSCCSKLKLVPATELQRVQNKLDQTMKDWSVDAIRKAECIVKLEKLLDEAVSLLKIVDYNINRHAIHVDNKDIKAFLSKLQSEEK